MPMTKDLPRFILPQKLENTLELPASEAAHLIKVMRSKIGDQIEITDGKGHLVIAEISQLDKRSAELKIIEEISNQPSSFGVHLAIAATKNTNRWEWVLEKTTEIGIDRISPILCDHSERKHLKQERQERIIESAVKQSKKTMIPQLDEMQSFNELMQSDWSGEKFIAHCNDSFSRIPLKEAHQANQPALLLIGPEGDFSPSEIELATKNGFISIEMGESRLRTETAAIIACHTLNLLND